MVTLVWFRQTPLMKNEYFVIGSGVWVPLRNHFLFIVPLLVSWPVAPSQCWSAFVSTESFWTRLPATVFPFPHRPKQGFQHERGAHYRYIPPNRTSDSNWASWICLHSEHLWFALAPFRKDKHHLQRSMGTYTNIYIARARDPMKIELCNHYRMLGNEFGS